MAAQEAAVVVAAGRERRRVPVGLEEWQRVQDAVAEAASAGGVLFTRGAVGVGEWEGRAEESVTAAGAVPAPVLPVALHRARDIARWHEQDSVAVTVGVTVLVEAEEPLPYLADVAARLRVLADALEATGL